MARMGLASSASLLVLAIVAVPVARGFDAITGRVLTSDDGTPAIGQPWRLPGPSVGGTIGVDRADGFFGDNVWPGDFVVWTESSTTDAGAPFGLRGEAALTRALVARGLTDFPVTQLARLPDPSAVGRGPGLGVLVSWSPMQACGSDVLEPQGLGAYAVYRSAAGADAWMPAGRTSGGASVTSYLDSSAPAGDWEWALKLVDVHGIEGTGFSLRTSAVTVAPLAPDFDGDTVRDDVDDCVDIPDPAQVDSDGDGVGDACEAGGTDALLYVRRGNTPAALGFSWTAVPGAVSHDLAAHDIPTPGSPGFFTGWRDAARQSMSCRLPTGSSIDLGDGRPARYYLLSTRFALHEEWGTDSFGVEHAATSPGCP